jgi:hypothetical protein
MVHMQPLICGQTVDNLTKVIPCTSLPLALCACSCLPCVCLLTTLQVCQKQAFCFMVTLVTTRSPFALLTPVQVINWSISSAALLKIVRKKISSKLGRFVKCTTFERRGDYLVCCSELHRCLQIGAKWCTAVADSTKSANRLLELQLSHQILQFQHIQ